MIAPVTIDALIADTRIGVAREAVVASLGRLLGGVKVVGHPGKLDINDALAKAIVTAPGIAVGYTRVRELADVGGTFTVAVDWVAYIVVENYADVANKRAIDREIVAHAIGLQLLRILRDPNASSWGIGSIETPSMDPPPAFTPVFTMTSAEQATALYAVTWTQGLIQEGQRFFSGPTPATTLAIPGEVAGDDEVVFDLPDGCENDYPPELLAHIRRGGP